MGRITWSVAAIIIVISCFTTSPGAITLEEVKQRGELNCGVSIGLPGFSNPDGEGKWSGLNVAFCRAVAAATVGDASRVKFIPLSGKNQMTALQSGEVDLLSMNVTWTMTGDTSLGLHFAGITYYDGQGFLVGKKLNITSALELNDVAVCLEEGSVGEVNLQAYLKAHKIAYKVIAIEDSTQSIEGLETGRCDVMTGKRSELYALLQKIENHDDFVILPEVISREPVGPIVRQGDDAWFNIVRWTLFAMINAEQYGVTSTTIEAMKVSADPNVQELLGLEGIKGKGLGLGDDWAYQIIRQVGNYGEIFDRNIGLGSPLKMDRGLNGLWNRGGILYAPPMR
jgi:general L-amino acid transport system substrate-binding protein